MTVTNDGASDTQAITMTADNTTPVITDPSTSYTFDNAATFTPTITNADARNLTLTITGISSGAAAVFTDGAATNSGHDIVSSDYAEAIQFTPATGSLTGSFTLTATNGSATDVQVVTMTANDTTPVITSDAAQSYTFNNPQAFDAIATNADDEDLVFAISSVTGGTAVFTSNSSASITSTSYTSNTATNGITFTPTTGAITGGFTLTVTNDGASDTQAITMTADNTTPVITDPSTSYTFDNAATFTPTITNADARNLTLTITGISSGAAAVFTDGAATNSGHDIVSSDYAEAIQFTPATGSLTGSFTLTATNGSATDVQVVTMTANDTTPVITSDAAQSYTFNNPQAFDAIATNADDEDLVFAISSVTGGTAVFTSNSSASITSSGYTSNTATNEITFTPTTGALTGGFILTVTNDGASDSQEITMTADNTTPSLTSTQAQSHTFNTLADFNITSTNADGRDLTFTITSISGGTAVFTNVAATNDDHDVVNSGYGQGGTATEEIRFTPTTGSTTSTFTITVANGASTDSHVVTFTAGNTTPSITSSSSQNYTFNTLSSFDSTATNADGRDLTFTISSVSGGTAVFNGNSSASITSTGYGQGGTATEQINFTPTTSGLSGSFTLTIANGGSSDSTTVNMYELPTTPTGAVDTSGLTLDDSDIVYTLNQYIDLPITITNSDGRLTTVQIDSAPSDGSTSITQPASSGTSQTATIRYTPDTGIISDSFTFKVNNTNSDNSQTALSGAVSVSLITAYTTPVVVLPDAADRDFTFNTAVTIPVTATNGDARAVTWSISTSPTSGNITSGPTSTGDLAATVEYTPTSGTVEDSFYITATNGSSTSDPLEIPVSSLPTTPVITDNQTIVFDNQEPKTIEFTATNADARLVVFSASSGPSVSGATATSFTNTTSEANVNQTGTFIYTPPTGQGQDDAVNIIATNTNSLGTSAVSTAKTITIKARYALPSIP